MFHNGAELTTSSIPFAASCETVTLKKLKAAKRIGLRTKAGDRKKIPEILVPLLVWYQLSFLVIGANKLHL